jgi:hypothetical protein
MHVWLLSHGPSCLLLLLYGLSALVNRSLGVDPLLESHSSSALPTLVCFLVFYQLMGKHLALLADVVFRFKSFSEAPRLA